MNTNVKEHYKKLLEQHGDSPESAQYIDRKTQERRFEILAQIDNLNDSSILDFGCGTGHFATYLEQNNIKTQYTGVDIVEEFFPYGREKFPQHRFGLLSDFQQDTFDYAFVSGVFNNKMDDNASFYKSTLKDLFGRVNKGLAFNMMSTYVDYQDDGLFYEKPEAVFEFVKTELSECVTLRHDYRVKPGVIPFEFAIYVYK